jgi:hypothetical protein
MSTFPPFENWATLSARSSAATAITVGELAGAPVATMLDGRWLSFPVAAMIRHPRARAAFPALVYDVWTGIAAPSDIEMIWQLFAIAQLIPASTLAIVPDPLLVSTFPQ